MNRLERYCADHAVDPVRAMNYLMERRLVADEAVLPADVEATDAERAALALAAKLEGAK